MFRGAIYAVSAYFPIAKQMFPCRKRIFGYRQIYQRSLFCPSRLAPLFFNPHLVFPVFMLLCDFCAFRALFLFCARLFVTLQPIGYGVRFRTVSACPPRQSGSLRPVGATSQKPISMQAAILLAMWRGILTIAVERPTT